jgi:hypothetical protein
LLLVGFASPAASGHAHDRVACALHAACIMLLLHHKVVLLALLLALLLLALLRSGCACAHLSWC